MDALKNYNVDFVKLKLGEHNFEYKVDDQFFSLKENSLITQGKVIVHLLIDKKERLMNLAFTLGGTINAECDTCLEAIELPLEGTAALVIKITDDLKESDDEIIYLSPNEISFNVYDYIYEIIYTHLPMTKTCNNAANRKDCNPEMLKFLLKSNNEPHINPEHTDPRWDKLKNIKN